jgi:Family of unknown function (DUF6328)
MSGPDEPAPSRRRLTRNWDELMQEIRVTQTGAQILAGFLLTVPFSTRFGELTSLQRGTYLTALGGAVLTTCLVVAPVAAHRLLFRRHLRLLLVETANVLALAGLGTLMLTIGGVAFLVVDIVVGTGWAVAAGSGTLVVFVGVWAAVPLGLARAGRLDELPPPEEDPADPLDRSDS